MGVPLTVLFQHLRDTKNVGDRWCSPYDWFDWPSEFQVKDLNTKSAPYKVGIYGGGKIFGGLAKSKGINRSKDALHIAWGVSTVQSFPLSLKYSRSKWLCDLVGSRDYGHGSFQWVPCASCMAPDFDQQVEPEHDVVFYYHAGKTEKQGIKIPESIPSLSNNCTDLREALRFISSGKTVVSNSYHGVYWSLLMGRNTICIPFSNKFFNYRLDPHYATSQNWMSQIDQAIPQKEMKSLCRVATLNFKSQVDTLIQKHFSSTNNVIS